MAEYKVVQIKFIFYSVENNSFVSFFFLNSSYVGDCNDIKLLVMTLNYDMRMLDWLSVLSVQVRNARSKIMQRHVSLELIRRIFLRCQFNI